MWNLKQGWKNIFAFNCLSLCSEVSPFAEEAGLRVIASFLFHKVGSPPAPPEPALRIVSSFFLASLDELSSRDNKPSSAALGGVWLGATSEQRELGLAGVWR